MWQDYKAEWVQVLSIGVGHTVAEAKAWKQQFGLTYPVLADPGGTVWNKFGMGYIPHNTVIDDLKICRYTNYGFYETQIRNTLTTYSAPLVKIIHTFLPNTEDTTNNYRVPAEIYSGGNLLTDSIAVYWNTDGGSTFTMVQMQNSGGDSYEASIPAQPTGTTVYYYIYAAADNGKSSYYPLAGPDGPARFEVLIDTIPPVIQHTPIEIWLAEFWPATVSAVITDTIGVATATLEFTINNGATQTVPMAAGSSDTFTATFTGSVSQGDVVNYRIHAVDSAQAQNHAYYPVSGWIAMTISQMVDALVLDLDGNANSGPAIRDALLSMGIETHYLTSMPPLPELYRSIWVCLGVAPNNYTLDSAEDTALYTYLVSGRTLYLEGGNFWKDDPRGDLYFEFSIGTLGSGAGDAGYMEGQAGSIAAGMTFNYDGDNNNIDQLKTKTGGVAVLKNMSPEYLTVVSRDAGTYSTIGSSVEWAGLIDGSREILLMNYATFFGLDPDTPQTPTPTPTFTPTPTPTSGCDTTGVTITMPSHDFGAGDTVNAIVTVCNADLTPYDTIPLFVILDV
ncbi:redoxin domain-containing protein, partial [bacterium]|nr:redoxin domain-containing protein [candidate division CSSED10-310 bacterium]